MGFFKALFAFIIFIILLIIGAWAYMGGFSKVSLERAEFGPVEIAYTTHKGSFSELGEAWENFVGEWADAGIETCDALAIYLDSPKDTPMDALRSILACRLDTASEADAAALRAAYPVFEIPQTEALTTSFPFKNYASYAVAPMRVYPKAEKYMAENGLEATVGIELYGVGETPDEIRFVIPVNEDPAVYEPLREAF